MNRFPKPGRRLQLRRFTQTRFRVAIRIVTAARWSEAKRRYEFPLAR
jgi:hypothetical protein